MGSRSACIVLLTAGNWAHRDPFEGRWAPRDENRCRETREETLGSANLSTNRQRIAELARTKAGTALSSLHHVIDLEWMKEAYRLTRKDGAPGIDGVTAADYQSASAAARPACPSVRDDARPLCLLLPRGNQGEKRATNRMRMAPGSGDG